MVSVKDSKMHLAKGSYLIASFSDSATEAIFHGESGKAIRRIPPHPGEMLHEEFLKPTGLTQVALAKHLGIPVQRINELIRGKRGVTPETAWLLAGAFGTSPEFWINLQNKSRPRTLTAQPRS